MNELIGLHNRHKFRENIGRRPKKEWELPCLVQNRLDRLILSVIPWSNAAENCDRKVFLPCKIVDKNGYSILAAEFKWKRRIRDVRLGGKCLCVF